MKALDQYFRAGRARSFARAIILLCLIGHASLVTLTHHHGRAQVVPRNTLSRVEADTNNDSNGPFGSSRDKCCPSCCLQRTFVSNIQPNSILPDLCLEQISAELFIAEPSFKGLFLVVSDRAPPLG